MYRKLMKVSALSVLALTLVAYGCDSLNESALVGPSESSQILLTSTDDDGYTVARETNPTVGVVTGIIDQKGGKLLLGKHYLAVPAGAVDGPTTFTMTKATDALQVELTATKLLTNDVGSAGFKAPLTLGLSYQNAAQVPEENLLKVVWMKRDGSLEVQQTAVDVNGKLVTGLLNHFSAYAVMIPE